MRRREFITLLGGAAAWPVAVRAQQGGRLPTIGFLGANATAWSSRTGAFVERLRELGETRRKLNEFVTELHAPRAPLGWSAYRVHGELAKLDRTAGCMSSSPSRRTPTRKPEARDVSDA